MDPAVVQLLQQVERDADSYLSEIVAPAWAKALRLCWPPYRSCYPFWKVVAEEARSGDKALRLLFSHYVFGHRR
ncbi:MAG: hypothetical protein D6724_09570, partial [Armatimonadetes bacterium]